MPKTNQWTIRGVPAEVIKESKAMAEKQRKPLGQYVREALMQHNSQKEGKDSKL